MLAEDVQQGRDRGRIPWAEDGFFGTGQIPALQMGGDQLGQHTRGHRRDGTARNAGPHEVLAGRDGTFRQPTVTTTLPVARRVASSARASLARSRG